MRRCLQVRREIDNLKEGVNERVQKLHEEAEEIERDAAEEIEAMRRGETPEPRGPQYVMYKGLDEEEDNNEGVTFVHEDEFKQGGLLVPGKDGEDSNGGEEPPKRGSKGEEEPPKDGGEQGGTEGGSDGGL